MIASTGILLFWFITIGLLTGLISFFVFRERGVKILPSIAMGVLGSLAAGVAALAFDLPGKVLYSIIGAVAFLFVTNSFRQKEKPIFMEPSESNSSQQDVK